MITQYSEIGLQYHQIELQLSQFVFQMKHPVHIRAYVIVMWNKVKNNNHQNSYLPFPHNPFDNYSRTRFRSTIRRTCVCVSVYVVLYCIVLSFQHCSQFVITCWRRACRCADDATAPMATTRMNSQMEEVWPAVEHTRTYKTSSDR